MGPKIFAILLFVVAGGIVLYMSRTGFLQKLNPQAVFSTSTPFFFGAATSSEATSVVPPIVSEAPTPTPPETPPASPPEYVPPPVEEPSLPPEINPYDIPAGYTAKQLSPYFHKVRFAYVAPGSQQDNYYGIITLAAGFESTGTIDITGWTFKANRTSSYVPSAVNFFYSSGANNEGEIKLKSGDVLNMYFGLSSPIGQNLRLNLCTGYLANHNTFTPDIPRSCPYPDQSEIQKFSGQCQDYVNSLGGCTEVQDNPPVPVYDYQCLDYLKQFNYAGCLNKYSSRQDFLGNEWWAWIGGWFLDPRHDQVALLDRNGLLVDLTSY